MSKKILTIVGVIGLIIIATSFWVAKDRFYIAQQMKNYEDDIINVLLNETKEIVRDVDVSQWNSFSDDVLGVQFKYPANVRVEYDSQVYAEEFDDVLNASVGGKAVELFFYDEQNDRLGFVRIFSFVPYTQLDIVFDNTEHHITKCIQRIDRRKNNRIHEKKYESVGYVQVDNQVFPWTVVDAGYKDVFTMSDVIYYNVKTDNIKDIEIRFYDHSKEDQDFLYGILRTLKFN